MEEETACAEPPDTRAACPGVSRAVDAGPLAVGERVTPLSPTGLCHRRTFGAQGVENKMDHSTTPAREFDQTPRSCRMYGSYHRLASCICPASFAPVPTALNLKPLPFGWMSTCKATLLMVHANLNTPFLTSVKEPAGIVTVNV